MTPRAVWVWIRGCRRPGEWLRTLERGTRAGWYVVLVGYKRRRRVVRPDAVEMRDA